MRHGNRSNHHIGPHYCDGCFLECARYGKLNRYQGYPCRPDVRRWARAHRDDDGDEDGYVFEEKKKAKVRADDHS